MVECAKETEFDSQVCCCGHRGYPKHPEEDHQDLNPKQDSKERIPKGRGLDFSLDEEETIVVVVSLLVIDQPCGRYALVILGRHSGFALFRILRAVWEFQETDYQNHS